VCLKRRRFKDSSSHKSAPHAVPGKISHQDVKEEMSRGGVLLRGREACERGKHPEGYSSLAPTKGTTKNPRCARRELSLKWGLLFQEKKVRSLKEDKPFLLVEERQGEGKSLNSPGRLIPLGSF